MAKILFVASNFPPVRGGSASVYSSLVSNTSNRTMVLAPFLDYIDELPLVGWREYDMRSQAKIIRIPLVRPPLLENPSILKKIKLRFQEAGIICQVTKQIAKAIVLSRIRVICVGELLSGYWILLMIKYIPGVKTIVYVHGEELTTRSLQENLEPRLRSALLASDAIIAVSDFTKRAAQGIIGDKKGHIILIPNGVDTTRFSPGAKRCELVTKYGLSNSFIFVSVCRLVEKKGLDKTIEAFNEIRGQIGDTKLLIVGAGPFYSSLQELVRRFALEDQVVFTGPIPEDQLVDHYRLGDVFVMPNRAMPNGDTEGFGLVFLEANGCGLPVIAGRDGGSQEAVQDGVSGLVVDGNSILEIGEAMMRLKYDEHLRQDLVRGGRISASSADWAGRSQAFLEVVSNVW